MNLRNLFPLFVLGSLIFTSCSTDDEPGQPQSPESNFDNGIFILNEGNYGSGNSTVSFLDLDNSEVNHQIFSKENEGELLGDTGQNMAFYKDYAFIVMNVSNAIKVVDRGSFKHIITIEENLNNPRFITFSEGKAFVTNWGDGMDPDDDFISVFNAETFTSLATISVSEGPERIVAGPGKVFAAHTGGFNINNRISVIDPVKNELNTIITVGEQPNSLVLDGDNLWVLSGGNPSYLDNESAGSLSQIDLGTLQITKQITFPNSTDHPSNLNLENEMLYYTLGTEVYTFVSAESSLPESPVFKMDKVEVLYGFKVIDSKFYAASASFDFTSNGKLYVYDLSGNPLNTYGVGVNPNGVYSQE